MVKLYIIKKPFYWHTKGIWTYCHESYLQDEGGNRRYFPKVIQCTGAVNQFVREFKINNPSIPVGYLDTTK